MSSRAPVSGGEVPPGSGSGAAVVGDIIRSPTSNYHRIARCSPPTSSPALASVAWQMLPTWLVLIQTSRTGSPGAPAWLNDFFVGARRATQPKSTPRTGVARLMRYIYYPLCDVPMCRFFAWVPHTLQDRSCESVTRIHGGGSAPCSRRCTGGDAFCDTAAAEWHAEVVNPSRRREIIFDHRHTEYKIHLIIIFYIYF